MHCHILSLLKLVLSTFRKALGLIIFLLRDPPRPGPMQLPERRDVGGGLGGFGVHRLLPLLPTKHTRNKPRKGQMGLNPKGWAACLQDKVCSGWGVGGGGWGATWQKKGRRVALVGAKKPKPALSSRRVPKIALGIKREAQKCRKPALPQSLTP